MIYTWSILRPGIYHRKEYFMFQFITIFLLTFLFNSSIVNAQSYTNTTNLFDGSVSQQLFNIAYSRIDKFLDYNYVIFQYDTSYFLIAFKDYTYDNNVLSTSDSTIIRYYRDGNNYNYSYLYDLYTESSSTFTTNYTYISNLNLNKASGSPIYQELLNSRYIVHLLMFLVALTFASFLLRERSSL